MSWLRYNDQDGVSVAAEAMDFDEVKKIYNRDRRNETKPFFNKVITYVYHTYAKYPHALADIFPSERKRRVCNSYFAGDDITGLEDDQDVIALIELYKKDSGSIVENFYEGLKAEMEQMLDHYKNVPMTRKQRVKRKIIVNFTDEKGNPMEQEVNINVMIEIDNSDEKMKVLQTADKLIDLFKKMKAKVVEERKEKSKSTRRKFDRQ